MKRSSLRLPEMDDPGTVGRWLVRHVVALTLGSLVILAALTAGALSLVRIEQTVEAAGTVERISSGGLGIVLQVPAEAAAQVEPGQAVRIEAAASPSSDPGPVLRGTVSMGPGSRTPGRRDPTVGAEAGSATVNVTVDLEGTGPDLQPGAIVRARIVTGRQPASALLVSSLKRKGRG